MTTLNNSSSTTCSFSFLFLFPLLALLNHYYCPQSDADLAPPVQVQTQVATRRLHVLTLDLGL
ncbi:hypothetical protein BDW02DRAFT_573095, partial [Decorospora gaudefroyi]